MKQETVHPARFQRKLELQGVASLQDALNVLSVFQDWRTGNCIRTMEELGLRPDLITAAIHYILARHKAQKPLFKCSTCAYNLADITCLRRETTCRYRKVNH